MGELKVEEAGFFTEIRKNERGLPIGGTQLANHAIPSDLKEIILYMRISGTPGSYWLTIGVNSYTEQPEVQVSFEPFPLVIRPDGHFHLTIPIEIEPFPMGRYKLTMRAAGKKLAEIGFDIGHKV